VSHKPVMLAEVIEALAPADGKTYVDGTFGAGGYTRAILEAANCNVIAIDRDLAAQERAAPLKSEFGDRFTLVYGCFGDVQAHLDGRKIDGFVLDIGVSSFQIDQAERGFSFAKDGPLDMRMDQGAGQTAADLVNTLPEEELAKIIYIYGEEKKSRRIAKKIVEQRAQQKITTTAQLANLVRSCVPKSKDGIDPATRTFQALRIAVNDELGELTRALNSAPRILKQEGRLVVVSFHSLEDRIVKQTMLENSDKKPSGSRYLPDTSDTGKALYSLPSKKALTPTPEETSQNPRSRSAKLRLAIRTDAEVAA